MISLETIEVVTNVEIVYIPEIQQTKRNKWNRKCSTKSDDNNEKGSLNNIEENDAVQNDANDNTQYVV